MTFFVSSITVAQAATIINAMITFVHFTISLSLVILLIHFMPKSNSALAWSSISRTLQSSLWPTILRTDSASSRKGGASVTTVSMASSATTALVAIAGVLLPLGLSEGPIVTANFRQIDAQYVPDTSALSLATTPTRGNFVFGRSCGSLVPGVPCPGNTSPNDTTLAPQVVEIFNSTPHGPFTMEYRRFFDDNGGQKPSAGIIGSAETFILRNSVLVAEGLIVDMSEDHPGIGFWNQTLPPFQHGGTWSEDVLWLEPVTQCVDTNVTIDYFMMKGPNGDFSDFNITDHGGFVNLTRVPPSLDRDGQHIDLWQHAYKGAAYSDLFAMGALNTTRNSSYDGASYPVNTSSSASLFGKSLGALTVLPISYLNGSAAESSQIICEGYGGADNANVSNVHVSCGVFLGPPLRTDGGDPRNFDQGSKWSQDVHACSSATRASIQTITFSTNSTTDIENLQITRVTKSNVLWATEKTNLTIADVDLLWGRVADQFENDPSLWTVRADGFYLPAGGASVWNAFPDGQPSSAHAHIWGQIYDPIGLSSDYVADYSGKNDYSIKTKMQSLVAQNPTIGNTQIRNLVWTDMMANNVIGTQKTDTVWAADHMTTLQYNFKYAIPGFLLLLIWLPSFLGAAFLLLSRSMTFQRMRTVLNHTSVGRVVVGTSALRVQGPSTGYMGMPEPQVYGDKSSGHRRNKSDWGNTAGMVEVALDVPGNLRNAPDTEEDIKLIDNPSPRR